MPLCAILACGGSGGDTNGADTGPDVAPDAPDLAEAAPAAPYTLTAIDRARITSRPDDPNFQHVAAAIDLVDAPFASATLVVDLDSTCFPFESWRDNPPPAGENWPADCDAFDRNFEITLDPPEGEGDPLGIELVRAITPFGGPMHFEADVTDVANGLPGPHTLDVHISTWSDGAGQVSGSDGGWFVSARLELVPGPAPRQVLAVIPLVNGSFGADADPEPVAFQTPEGAVGNRLEYRATGHGGAADPSHFCIGPAEEFCRRTHQVLVDGELLVQFVPWRDDCTELCTRATFSNGSSSFEYCAENPMGAIASVEAPRAGWCPGDLVPPYTWGPTELDVPGAHTFDYAVLGVYPGGSWRISAVLFVFGE